MAERSFSFSSPNLEFVEALYVDYLNDPTSVPESFRRWFDGLESDGQFERRPQLGPTFTPKGLFVASLATDDARLPASQQIDGEICEAAIKQERLEQLVRAFRERGHLAAKLDPLGLPRPRVIELEPESHGLTVADLERSFSAKTVSGPDVLTLREILERLRNTYCRSIGVQFMHIGDAESRRWLRQRMEETENRIHLSRDGQLRILTKLTDAVMFEEFLQTKYIGAKIFSLEGSESLIPLLSFAIDRAAEQGVDEVVVAMAHRGRLNVLANIVGKSPREIFREFEDRDPELFLGSGDVKYHLGYRSSYDTPAGRRVGVSLCFNPSHLEYVNPVALGRTRARQDRDPSQSRNNKLPILIHGDAALAGEGIVAETLNLGGLGAYTTGGAIHIVVNNQIGFTTPPGQGRSSIYATDVAKMLDIPVFHVNGEDPEAVAQVVQLAVEFRERFARDVFIDMYGYRRHGHNEGDEPAFTQPLLYAAISRRKSVRDGYLEHLLELGGVTREEAEQIAVERHRALEVELTVARSVDYPRAHMVLGAIWQAYQGGAAANVVPVDTALAENRVVELLTALTQLPQGFKPHRKLERLLEQRLEMAKGERRLDWGAAEALALASLVTNGVPVRFTGQDCERGTFSHRHAAIHDVETGEKYFPLAHLASEQSRFEIHNSPLSEAAVLGFEYGFSLECPDWFVIWEAQFGDFGNVAQVVVDQFIASAEDKWKQLSGITLLLPHGYEGMGPEHSSARIERWLVLAAEDNIQICQPSTPAQVFHLFRRQALSTWRKPLVVFTPKSLLRHPMAQSPLSAFTSGQFQHVIADEMLTEVESRQVRRVLLCSGKAYYSLVQRRDELAIRDVAIVRVEQFYPLKDECLRSVLTRYPSGCPLVWVQEEPENMGAWRYFRARFGTSLWDVYPLTSICRVESASPATGSSSSHRVEQEELLTRAFST
jgi:2-oxoglutarate dehydrogenase E1 component